MESTEKSLSEMSQNQQTQTREQNKLKPLVHGIQSGMAFGSHS